MSKEHYLLDTMTLLWFAFLPKRLPKAAREVLLDEAANLSFSTVSLWEIGLKLSGGGYTDFKFPNDWAHCIPEGLKQQGIALLTIEPEHCQRIQDLPFHHRDPFDRMLVAQCQTQGRTILSSDAIFDAYGVKRVW